MSKRPAEEPLEQTSVASPASKRARVEDDPETTSQNVTHIPSRLRHSDKNGEEAGAVNGTGEEDEDDEEADQPVPSRQKAPTEGYNDLYLDTIDRKVLDFDFEKLCSVTLSNMNVYACLVCGKYFQGRGTKSQAYFHALEEDHHPYINLESRNVYILPEGYEVQSRSLDDIKFVADPWLPHEDVLTLDKKDRTSYDLEGRKYAPGFVGLNNIKANDYFNVVIHALAHVPPLRNYFIDPANRTQLASRPRLAQRFSILIRKLYNPRAFKMHVSPHELLQEVSARSDKRFTMTEQSDPVDFLSWFLNNLHLAVGGSRSKPHSSVVQRAFQGRMRVESQVITARADAGDRLRFEDAAVQSQTAPFMLLTLDLPPAPLFQDELDRNAIPQVPLTALLAKYDGMRSQERLNTRVRYRLLHPLPPYLIFHVKRFSKNKFVAERNPTIVTFPTLALDMSPYVEPNPALWPPGEPLLYDLLANVTHEAVRIRDDSVEGEAERKVWRAQVRNKPAGEWVEFQDLFVEKADADRIYTKETYAMVWERRSVPAKARTNGAAVSKT